MRHVVRAVFVGHVVHHLAAQRVLEVFVYVRHRNAVRIEEALEEQVVGDRIHVGDAEAVRHGRAGRRAAPGADEDPHLPRRLDVVVDDEEVAREAHVADGVELEVDAFALLRVERFPGPAPARPFERQVPQVVGFEQDAAQPRVAVGRASAEALERAREEAAGDRGRVRELFFVAIFRPERFGDREHRHDRRALQPVFFDFFGDFERVGERFGVLREDFRHFVAALEPFLARVAQALHVGFERLGREAQQDVVRLGLLLEEKMGVVRRDDLYPELFAEGEDLLVDAQLRLVKLPALGVEKRSFGLVEHHLQVVVVAEQRLVPPRRALGAVVVERPELRGDFSRYARGGADEPLVELFQHFFVDPGAAVETFQVRHGTEAHEILVAGEILREQDEVVPGAVFRVGLVLVFVGGGAARDIRLAAEYRLEGRQRIALLVLARRARLVESLEAEQDAVVGYRERRHPELARPRCERRDLAHSVQQRIRGVDVQRDERRHVPDLGTGKSSDGENGGSVLSFSDIVGSGTGQAIESAGLKAFTPPSSPGW